MIDPTYSKLNDRSRRMQKKPMTMAPFPKQNIAKIGHRIPNLQGQVVSHKGTPIIVHEAIKQTSISPQLSLALGTHQGIIDMNRNGNFCEGT